MKAIATNYDNSKLHYIMHTKLCIKLLGTCNFNISMSATKKTLLIKNEPFEFQINATLN